VPTERNATLFEFAPVEGRQVATFDGDTITSDAGALLSGQTDRTIRMTDRFTARFTDARTAELMEHEVGTLVLQRVLASRWATRTSTTMTNCGTVRCWRQACGAAHGLRAAGGQVDPESAGAEPRRSDERSQGEPPSGSNRDAAPHSIGCVCMGEKLPPAPTGRGQGTLLLIADLWGTD